MRVFGHSAVDEFAHALMGSELKPDDITEMHRAGYHLSEIADRVSARSGLDVTEAHVAAWLTTEGGFDACRNTPDGRSECGRPSDPSSAAGWCRSCQRSN